MYNIMMFAIKVLGIGNFLVVITTLIIGMVMTACNLPSNSDSALPDAVDTIPSVDSNTQPSPEEPSDSKSALESLDPLVILDTYASLKDVNLLLNTMKADHMPSGTTDTGRQVLEMILNVREYDPTMQNDLKEELFSALDDYSFAHAGARIFLINVATGLYAEAHGSYPWSLQDYSAQMVNNIFIEDSVIQIADFVYEPGFVYQRGDIPAGMPNLNFHYPYPVDNKMIEDAHYKQFNLAGRLAQDAVTQEKAVSLIAVWMQQNFFHAVDGYGWEVYLDGRAPSTSGPVAFPLSIERIYVERVVGCHEPTIMLEGMLHSLNIPAVRLMVHGHGVLYLPSLDRYIHGDHVANYTDAPYGLLLLTPEEFRPYAEDVSWIFQIYMDKYQSPMLSVPLKRDGDYLYLSAANLRNFPDTTCIQVSDDDWARLSEQLSAYNIRYDDQICELSSDWIPILTLDELNRPDS
jgi:hypothetical protein